jgi:hypothetical protein
MTFRSRFLSAAFFGLCMTLSSRAQEPGRFQLGQEQLLAPQSESLPNQRAAEAIADQLRLSAQLRHYCVEVVFKDGTADLSGNVADQSQREEVLRIVQGVPGVDHVVDHLALKDQGAITPVQAPTQNPLPPPNLVPLPRKAENGPENNAEPVPSSPLQSPSFYDVNQPKMPPYAWPTYAPFNNYSRVAYPEAYPYNAWPFIGPVYPFPKIPLGWRSVKLEWQDGHWWFSKLATKHDWWRVRYW